MKLSRILMIAATMAVVSPPSFAAVHYSIGFTGVQRGLGVPPRAAVEYVDVVVGSDETDQSATAQTFAVYLKASGPAGSCNVFNEVSTKVHPPVHLLRFAIRYASAPSPSGPKVKYSLSAYTTGPFHVTNSASVEFPQGGKVSCVKLPVQ